MSAGPDFDAAVISASPLGLSEALLLAREGKRVVVCDRRDAIGGAWRVEDTVGYRDVEVGCRIFIPDARVPAALRQLWNVSWQTCCHRRAPSLLWAAATFAVVDAVRGTPCVRPQGTLSLTTHQGGDQRSSLTAMAISSAVMEFEAKCPVAIESQRIHALAAD